jgi:Flp pilus assembly protein TadG
MWFKGLSRKRTGASRRGPRRISLDPRGQGLVEFAIAFPVVMLMITFGVDFGRVFLGWVTLNNAVREAANFAALNPNGFQSPVDLAVMAEYRRLITAETQGINCTMPGTPPNPTYPGGTSLGSPAVVAMTCRFSLITPIISNILGSQINVSASASFPVRAGSIEGTPLGQGLPSFSTTTTTTTTTSTTTSTSTTSTSTTTTTTTTTAPTPVPNCIVPDLVDVQTTQATARWTSAGFSANNLAFNPLVPPNYKIKAQSVPAGNSILCNSTMTVTP